MNRPQNSSRLPGSYEEALLSYGRTIDFHTRLSFQDCWIYLCGTKRDLVNSGERNRDVPYDAAVNYSQSKYFVQPFLSNFIYEFSSHQADERNHPSLIQSHDACLNFISIDFERQLLRFLFKSISSPLGVNAKTVMETSSKTGQNVGKYNGDQE